MSNISRLKTVSEVAKEIVVTVDPTTKLDVVAQQFEESGVNAAPVVDGLDKCVGIITSRDIVRYESLRNSSEKQFKHGIAFDLCQAAEDDSFSIFGRPFDEVAYHMSSDPVTIQRNAALSQAGRIMCDRQIHHLLVLDDFGRPIGILSALDILSQVLAESASFYRQEQFVGLGADR